MLVQEDALLLVVDIQDVLMPADAETTRKYLDQSVKLIQAAHILDVPIIATEQNPERLGGTNARVVEALGAAPRLPKIEFGCLANEGIARALRDADKKQLLIIGMETHVCVMQTALEAMEKGYEVFIVADAVVSSRKDEYKAGLARMTQAGTVLVTVEMAIFELLRRAGTPAFKGILPIIKGSKS